MKKAIKYIVVFSIILSVLFFALGGCKNTTYKYPNAKKYHEGAGSYSADIVKAVNVAWDEGVVNVICSNDVTMVNVSEENNITDTDYILHQYVDEDGTLWVKPYASKIKEDNIPQFEKKILTITMPKKMLESAYFENHGYTINVDGLQTKNLETYNTGTGTVVTNAVVTASAKMTAQGLSGNCSLSGEIAGEVNITTPLESSLISSVVPSKITITSKRYIHVTLPETLPGFTAVVSKASNFTSFMEANKTSESEEDATATYVAGNGSLQMVLKCSKEPIGDRNNIAIIKIPTPIPPTE